MHKICTIKNCKFYRKDDVKKGLFSYIVLEYCLENDGKLQRIEDLHRCPTADVQNSITDVQDSITDVQDSITDVQDSITDVQNPHNSTRNSKAPAIISLICALIAPFLYGVTAIPAIALGIIGCKAKSKGIALTGLIIGSLIILTMSCYDLFVTYRKGEESEILMQSQRINDYKLFKEKIFEVEKPSVIAINLFINSASKSYSKYELYTLADNADISCKNTQKNYTKLRNEIPQSMTKENKKALNDILTELYVAYAFYSTAFKNAKSNLDTDRPSYLSKYSKNVKNANEYTNNAVKMMEILELQLKSNQ